MRVHLCGKNSVDNACIWIYFLRDQSGPHTARNPLFPLSNAKRRRQNFAQLQHLGRTWRKSHQCSCIFAFPFHHYEMTAWPISLDPTGQSTLLFLQSSHLVYPRSFITLVLYSFIRIDFHAPLSFQSFHHAFSRKSASFTGIGNHSINFCLSATRFSQ